MPEEYTKPSDAIKDGKCPSCWGTGEVERVVPAPGIYPCSTCAGTGLWPPPGLGDVSVYDNRDER